MHFIAAKRAKDLIGGSTCIGICAHTNGVFVLVSRPTLHRVTELSCMPLSATTTKPPSAKFSQIRSNSSGRLDPIPLASFQFVDGPATFNAVPFSDFSDRNSLGSVHDAKNAKAARAASSDVSGAHGPSHNLHTHRRNCTIYFPPYAIRKCTGVGGTGVSPAIPIRRIRREWWPVWSACWPETVSGRLSAVWLNSESDKVQATEHIRVKLTCPVPLNSIVGVLGADLKLHAVVHRGTCQRES
ncbi:hypothetical protein DFH07DRAFT_1000482 [Mycena maculata]|uniref:Uncharacterized protein n=1 Tax=Mycena maculata TaxID=230809 RepID=A0AAD7MPE6_9AGAR|nr:hypothetical protein DFH07DRAFT_1000482 [Mycena maculata]